MLSALVLTVSTFTLFAKLRRSLPRLIETKGEDVKKRVAIAYDSRHFSPEFAFESAQVLAKHGIKHMFSNHFAQLQNCHLLFVTLVLLLVSWLLQVTTLLHLMVTVYGEDGGQMPPADADA